MHLFFIRKALQRKELQKELALGAAFWHIRPMIVEEVRPAEILSEKPLTEGPALGPRLKALLLAQPLNQLQPLRFHELPSRQREESLS